MNISITSPVAYRAFLPAALVVVASVGPFLYAATAQQRQTFKDANGRTLTRSGGDLTLQGVVSDSATPRSVKQGPSVSYSEWGWQVSLVLQEGLEIQGWQGFFADFIADTGTGTARDARWCWTVATAAANPRVSKLGASSCRPIWNRPSSRWTMCGSATAGG